MGVRVSELDITKVDPAILRADDIQQKQRLREWREGMSRQRQQRRRDALDALEEMGIVKRLEEVKDNWGEGNITVESWIDPMSREWGIVAALRSGPYYKFALAGAGERLVVRKVPEQAALQVMVIDNYPHSRLMVRSLNIYDVLAGRGLSVSHVVARHGIEEGLRRVNIDNWRVLGIDPLVIDLQKMGATSEFDVALNYAEGARKSYDSSPRKVRSWLNDIRRDLPPFLRR